MSVFDLITALNDVLKRVKPDVIGEIYADTHTVADQIEVVLRRVRSNARVTFTSLFGESATRHEVICTFLALLELMRLRQIAIVQSEHFGEIVLTSIEPGA
jgi:segregation and condensation protein A